MDTRKSCEGGISVIICAYTEERWEQLVEALDSVRCQTLPPQEMIVVIDHNPSLFARSRQIFKDVCVLENAHARGLSGARNTGIARARGQIIAFMDEDALADSTWLESLARIYADSSVMGVGGLISPLWVDGRPTWFPEEFNWVVGCTYRGVSETAAPVRNLIGCNMSFRADVFRSIGGFRSGIGRIGSVPLGCEETELCIRASQQFPGQKFIYTPTARVAHRVPSTRTRFEYFRSRCYAEGLSKALITSLVGGRDGLRSERAYTFKTLPLGVLRGMGDVIARRDISGFGRAFAIVIGLLLTTWGYVLGKVSIRKPTLQKLESGLINEPLSGQ